MKNASWIVCFFLSTLSNASDEKEAKLIFREAGRTQALEYLRKKAQTTSPYYETFSRVYLKNESYLEVQEAILWIQSKKYKDALELLEKAVQKEGEDHLEINLRKFQALYLEGKTEKLSNLAEKLEKDLHVPEVSLWLGRYYFHEKRFSKAQEYLEKADQKLSSSQLSALWLSDYYWDRGLKEQSVARLQDQAKKYPHQIEVLLQLSSFLLLEKKSQEARVSIELGLSRLQDPHSFYENSSEGEMGLELFHPDDQRARLESFLLQANQAK